MFKSQNRIIIVDDQEKDLFDLSKRFSEKGLASRVIHYKQPANNQKLVGVRLAFFDINLTQQTINLNQKTYDHLTDPSLRNTFNSLAVAIDDIIAPENGPYALIFWSINTALIDNFKDYVNSRKEYISIPEPIFIDCIDKSKVDEIDSKIDELFTNRGISLLNAFERECEIGATNTINDLFSIIPKKNDLQWGETDETFEKNFNKTFKAIGTAISGGNSDLNLDKAIISGLLPILGFHIGSNPGEIWSKYLKDTEYEELSAEVAAKLNTTYHINASPEEFERGAVYLLDKKEKTNFDEWAMKLLSWKIQEEEGRDIEKIKERNEAKRSIIAESKLIGIEISASCDYSQNRPRKQKYVLGLLTNCLKKNSKKLQGTKGMNYLCPDNMTFFLEELKEFQIHLDLNMTISRKLEEKFDNSELRFSFKKELVDMIGDRYANHVSRIGITSF